MTGAVARAERAALACARCGAAFAREDHLALHVGRAHGDLERDERARFEAALAAEEAWLREFQRHVRAGLNLVPIAAIYLLILLLVGWSGVPIMWGFLLLPGVVMFSALIYYVSYSKTDR